MVTKTSSGDRYEEILHRQPIDETGPGSVLHDFKVLRDFIGAEGIPISSKRQFIPLTLLSEINAKLHKPMKLALKRPVQRSYPHLNGLYLLLRTTGLGRTVGSGKAARLVLDKKSNPSWQALNPTEQYFTLLEAWLLWGYPEIAGEDRSLKGFSILVSFQKILSEGRVAFTDIQAQDQHLRYHPGYFPLALMELFGLMNIEHKTPEPGKGWRIKSIEPTPLGRAIWSLLLGGPSAKTPLADDIIVYPGEPIQFGRWQPLFQPFFPEWCHNLEVPEPPLRDGQHVFKVSLGKAWRRIAIPGEAGCDQLAHAILDAFDFDYEHLYRFEYRGRFGATEYVNHPYMEEPLEADEVRIGSLPLDCGASMAFVYDFGDNWTFNVLLESVQPRDRRQKRPLLLESRGEAPEQYPSYDEDW
jgi:hypothetical protein